MLILDGTANKVIINPTSEQMDEYARFAEEQRQVYLQLMHRLEKTKREPLKTRDGQVIHVHANISTSDEVQPALMNGAESLALIRTELMAMINGGTLPEHIWEENFRHIMNEDLLAYVQFYPDMPPDKRPVPVFRTLDLTGDKKGDVSEPQEPKQIRALLKALKSNENFRGSILIPMVEDVFAFNALHAFMELEAKTLETKPVDFGAMLENATIIGPDMEQLRANYFSVGTNDLYTACAKQFDGENGYRELAPETAEAKEAASALRYDETLEKFKDQTHPFFLGKLKEAREIAAKLDKPICICGDMASDLRYRPLLLGLGYESTSVGPSAIPGVYEYDARLDSRECAALATKVMNTPDKASRDMLLVEFGERHGLHRNGTLDIDWQPPGQEHQPVPPGH